MDNDKINAPGAEDEAGEYDVDLITLTDEDGVEHTFELADTLEHNGNDYVALITAIEDGAEAYLEDDGDLVIMKIVSEDNGEEILEIIEDDDEFDEISDIFMSRLSDMYEFEEGDKDADTTGEDK
ncbi:MAG: DUF1292 domain-containing protein [Oscillospiraceae bacterium]|nr:DUF1292 domain-containing protein [Oscillospiraceae bacterium]